MYIYRTNFELTACVNDFCAARDYLVADNMTKYMQGDSLVPDETYAKIEKIEWILRNEWQGYIELKTKEKLTDNELEGISEWVAGQCDGGLGEGFEQQDFACYEEEGLEGYDGDDWDNEEILASFDWKNNDFIFELISDNV